MPLTEQRLEQELCEISLKVIFRHSEPTWRDTDKYYFLLMLATQENSRVVCMLRAHKMESTQQKYQQDAAL